MPEHCSQTCEAVFFTSLHALHEDPSVLNLDCYIRQLRLVDVILRFTKVMEVLHAEGRKYGLKLNTQVVFITVGLKIHR